MPSATSLAASPSRSSTVTAAPARESLSAQARPIPLAAPVTNALRPVRSTLTDDGPDTVEASFMFLLHPGVLLTRSFPRTQSKNHVWGRAPVRRPRLSRACRCHLHYDAARGCSEVSRRRRYVPAGSPTPSAKA